MIISNTLTALVKINEIPFTAFKYTSKNNFSESDLIEFIELIYNKIKSLNNLDEHKLSIELFAGEQLISSSDNIKKYNYFWQYPSFAEIIVSDKLYEVHKYGFARIFKNRIFTLNRQLKEGRIFKNTFTISTSNFLTGKKIGEVLFTITRITKKELQIKFRILKLNKKLLFTTEMEKLIRHMLWW